MKLISQCATPTKTDIFLKGKGWALYQKVSELIMSSKEGGHMIKRNYYAKWKCLEMRASSPVEGITSFSEGVPRCNDLKNGNFSEKKG